MKSLEITVNRITTKASLLEMLGCKNKWVIINGIVGILQSIQREDGSGNCFNVGITLDGGTSQTVFVRFNNCYPHHQSR